MGIFGGIATLAGDVIGANSAKSQQKFEERMADTTYQRTVADMKKAGLNPMMMMAKGGGTDPAPSGTGVEQGKIYGDAASKALQTMLLKAQIDSQQANARQTNAQTLSLLPQQVADTTALARRHGFEADASQYLQQAAIDTARANARSADVAADVAVAGKDPAIANLQLQPGLTSAQTQAARASAASAGQAAERSEYGELSKWTGTAVLDGMRAAWQNMVRSIGKSSSAQVP